MSFVFFLTGIITLLALAWLLSAKKKEIKLRPILWGISLQFVFGLLVMKWETGRRCLKVVSDGVASFLDFSLEGADFLFAKLAHGEYFDQFGYQWVTK